MSKIDKRWGLGLSYIVAGILISVFKQEVFKWICACIGAFIIVIGVISLIDSIKTNNRFKESGDIVSICIGILLFVMAWFVIRVITIILGIILIIYGAYYFFIGLTFGSGKGRYLIILESVFNVIVGILLFIDSPSIYLALGIILALTGALELVTIPFSPHYNESKMYSERKENNIKNDAIEVEVEEKEIDE